MYEAYLRRVLNPDADVRAIAGAAASELTNLKRRSMGVDTATDDAFWRDEEERERANLLSSWTQIHNEVRLAQDVQAWDATEMEADAPFAATLQTPANPAERADTVRRQGDNLAATFALQWREAFTSIRHEARDLIQKFSDELTVNPRPAIDAMSEATSRALMQMIREKIGDDFDRVERSDGRLIWRYETILRDVSKDLLQEHLSTVQMEAEIASRHIGDPAAAMLMYLAYRHTAWFTRLCELIHTLAYHTKS